MSMKPVYITHTASALPNDPVDNDRIELVLGQIQGKPSRARRLILRNNGIKTRYYVIDPDTGAYTHTNAELTAEAIRNLFSDPSAMQRIDLIACGTTLADQLAPGHAVMVHGQLQTPPCEAVSTSSICISGLMALKYAYLAVKSGDATQAVATGSETASTLLQSQTFTAESEAKLAALADRPEIGFEKDFLRWMLSDGAGAMCLQPIPQHGRTNLRIRWIKTYSFANQQPACMFAGALQNDDGTLTGWRQVSPESLLDQSVLSIKQNVKQLNERIIPLAVTETLSRIIDETGLTPDQVDHFLPHISSMYFYDRVARALDEMHFSISDHKWFTNLSTKGNTGSASIFIMLDEFVRTRHLTPGETILCFVPESGRFSSGFMLLEVAETEANDE
ncbi:MAG: beta-ketoacyl-ACP synthase III [Hydrogenovibrio sp.]|uniref:beta-ketoacyl-ACP synthase III n=1 Tax=Hydrogenovibrio sp. TaxID=2065821 RepID=UPI002870157F|nr:beta-ketoacyl-ACP synthase III [Hydrogenovibrio sp.]MDR9499837.1 beta-ketoacyl-ACP synthase III [Hydrogenovibrio sp.]